jgi:tRNA modification GTPase
VGIVRLSGGDLSHLVGALFVSKRSGLALRDRRPHLGKIRDERGQVLDEGLLLWFAAPHSFTGEDVVELHCHGNPWILERIVLAALALGARAAQPGEFTRRAYLSGRLDLVQADAVMQLISASSEKGVQAARRLLNGELSRQIQAIQAGVIDVLKWLEMAIDFPEEDIEPASDAQLLLGLQGLEGQLQRLCSSFRQGNRVRQGVRVVLCGRANVGKSSLFNRLLGYRRSIVADVPGTTRDVVESRLELGGISVLLQDTAGIRETLDVLESEGIDLTREAIGGAELALLVVDGSSPRQAEDEQVLALLRSSHLEWIGVLNKCDRGIHTDWADLLQATEERWLATSSSEGEGLDPLQVELTRRVEGGADGEALLITSRWQKELLEKMVENVRQAAVCIRDELTPEATAFELYECLDRVDELLGTNGREAVLDRIFADFCLGK